MKKIITTLFLVIPLLACVPLEVKDVARGTNQNDTGTLQLGDRNLGAYTIWECRDYSRGGPVVLELLRADTEISEMKDGARDLQYDTNLISGVHLGFILLDDRKEHLLAVYTRDGINHRWDWKDNKDNAFAIVIDLDGTGFYYDFSDSKDGRTTSRDMFECEKLGR